MLHGAPVVTQERRKPAWRAGLPEQEDEKRGASNQRKAEYYKFYLDNAQKAINLMI